MPSTRAGRDRLSFVAGYVDTLGFIALFGLFTAHVTGNFVLIGAELERSGNVLLKILAFPAFIIAVALTAPDRALARSPPSPAHACLARAPGPAAVRFHGVGNGRDADPQRGRAAGAGRRPARRHRHGHPERRGAPGLHDADADDGDDGQRDAAGDRRGRPGARGVADPAVRARSRKFGGCPSSPSRSARSVAPSPMSTAASWRWPCRCWCWAGWRTARVAGVDVRSRTMRLSRRRTRYQETPMLGSRTKIAPFCECGSAAGPHDPTRREFLAGAASLGMLAAAGCAATAPSGPTVLTFTTTSRRRPG